MESAPEISHFQGPLVLKSPTGSDHRIQVPASLSASESLQRISRRTGSLALLITGIAICAMLVVMYSHACFWMYRYWITDPNYSHGILVPPFAAGLLWARRAKLINLDRSTSQFDGVAGIGCILFAAAMLNVGIYTRTVTLEALSILPCFLGLVLSFGGRVATRWALPSILFLVFMIPLPQSVGTQLGETLQRVATMSSTFMLQLLGVPAVAEGNIILLTHATLGVAEACSGIRMLMTFIAIATAICFVVERPILDKIVIWLSSPVIAVVANVLRITATGVAYEFGNEKLAELIFHDLAGWLMMPLAMLLLWGEMFLLSKVFEEPDREEKVMRGSSKSR